MTRMIIRHVVMVCALLPAVVSATATASPGRQACIGAPADHPPAAYDETRQFVDFQAWWRTTQGQAGTDFGHAHVGACIPEREQMQGATIPLDIRLVLHDNPAKRTDQYPWACRSS